MFGKKHYKPNFTVLELPRFVPEEENLSDVYILIFAGLVSALDNLVGETVRALRKSRLYDNTVIFFSSDVS